jgi:hypothetical protein
LLRGEKFGSARPSQTYVLKEDHMHINRKLTKTVLAVVVPIGLIGSVALFSGVASAKKAPAATISCTAVTGVITFSPALQPGPTNTTGTDGKAGFTITIGNGGATGCTTTPASSVTAGVGAGSKGVKVKGGNTCENVTNPPAGAKPTKYTITTNWNNGGGTSVGSWKGSTFSEGGPTGAEFTLSGGKTTGSYPTKNTGSLVAYLKSSDVAALLACANSATAAPVSTINISGGTASS